MTVIAIVFLLCLATVFAFFHYSRITLLPLLIALISVCLIGYGVVGGPLLKGLQAPFIDKPPVQWKANNAIILLGGGLDSIPNSNHLNPSLTAYSRVVKAAELYVECKQHNVKCTILISGGYSRKKRETEAGAYSLVLQALNIPLSDQILESKSRNTYENATFIRAILKTHSFDQAVLVTSGFHMQRAVFYFDYVNVPVVPVTSDYLMVQHWRFPLAYNFVVTDLALHEYVGIARLKVYDWMGWNQAAY